MSNDPKPPLGDAPETPRSQISPDFLIGDVRTGLERIRIRLLDLTNRNKLLNFRHSTASSLRIVEVHLDTVFKRLQEGEKLHFQAVPEPDGKGSQETTNAAEYAAELGWRTSYELSQIPPPKTYNGSLPVLHYVEKLDALFRKISGAARTAIEESGTNMLYLSMGFLEWYESDDSSQARQAPLVIVPVVMEKRTGRGKTFSCELEYSGEDIETNLSLVEKMRRDFGFDIPLWEDEDTPETYFLRFDELLKVKKRWLIRREITLSLLSFAKLLMFRDLDSRNWPAGYALDAHSIVRELFEGTKSSDSGYAEEFPIDSPELRTELPPLIMDADSSQHSAMIQAMRGANLVIEGPPGTGKSQTITNLIAAAMAKGKTVLFVSEKLAALEVVRRRLDECGLGIFCLEIHSHKTQKGNLFSDLADRLKKRGSFRDAPELERHSVLAAGKRHRLIEYVTLINETIDPLQSTIFEILWARERAYRALTFSTSVLSQVLLPSLATFSHTDYDRAEDFCGAYSRHIAVILGPSHNIEEHPWAWVLKVLSFDEEEACLNLLEDFLKCTRNAKAILLELSETFGLELSSDATGLEQINRMLAAIPSTDGSIMGTILAACHDELTRQALSSFADMLNHFQMALGRVMSVATKGDTLLDAQVGENKRQISDSLNRLGLEACSLSELKELIVSNRKAERVLSQTRLSFEALRSFFGWEATIDAETIAYLLVAADTLENVPTDLLYLRMSTLISSGSVIQLEAAKAEADSLRRQRSGLTATFSLSQVGLVANPPELLRHATTLDQTSFLRRFGKHYRSAVILYKTLALNGRREHREQMAQGLRSLSGYYKRVEDFTSNSTYRFLLGTEFRGTDTKWDELLRLGKWYEGVNSTFPEHIPHSLFFRELFFNGKPEVIRKLRSTLPSLAPHRSQLGAAMSGTVHVGQTFPSPRTISDYGGSFDDFVTSVTFFNNVISSALTELDQIGVPETFTMGELVPLLTAASEARYEQARIDADQVASRVLGKNFQGVSTEAAPLQSTLRFAEVIASRTFSSRTAGWILCDEYETRLAQLKTWLTKAQDLLSRISTLREELAGITCNPIWKDLPGNDPETLNQLASQALEVRDELPRWIHLLRLRAEGAQLGLQKLIALANARAFEPGDLPAAFAFVFYNSLARSVFSTHSQLSEFTGMTLDQLRDQFAKADREVIRLFHNRIAAIIDRRPIHPGNKTGPVGSWTEFALLSHEVNKQKRHIPIRRLLRRAGNTMLALKPCFMMGPLSVAQYLAPGGVKFDLVVMDEASQLRPEDAIGAIARGGQVVIVGDPKQLPPSTFFQRTQMDGETDDADDDLAAVEEGESILDVASTLYQPVRRLRWHYRSRHHSLIAFSNKEFYNDDLVIFPSAYREHPSLGIKYVAVDGAIFDERRNQREASLVVDAMLEHVKTYPSESLGVVALNFEQKELIEELFDSRARNDAFALSYMEKMKWPDELFIKNLENVQGDERDVIFISVTYGPDSLGNQFQRFGPINGPNGHRRLNVLFTRAKKRIIVFSSLDPEKIHAPLSSAWGVRALKQYLTFARTGILENSHGPSEQTTNDFENSVGAVLREKGFEVVPQVGVAGFFIDLGVIHPARPGAFLLGIECDGASYHSGRSARDRDRLRQEILESHGWKIYRIWSTDWFRSRDKEIERLFKHIEALLASRGEPAPAIHDIPRI